MSISLRGFVVGGVRRPSMIRVKEIDNPPVVTKLPPQLAK
jgi:hypothetical protein